MNLEVSLAISASTNGAEPSQPCLAVYPHHLGTRVAPQCCPILRQARITLAQKDSDQDILNEENGSRRLL